MIYQEFLFKKENEYFIHENNDVRVAKTAVIKIPLYTFFGNHVAIDHGVYVSTKLLVYDYVHLGAYTSIIGGKEAECIFNDFSWTSAGVKIVCGGETPEGLINPTVPQKYRDMKYGNVEFCKFAGAYVNSVILQGVKLAEGSILGANSLLKENTEPWTIYAGSPAKEIAKRPKEKVLKYARELGYQY